MKQKEINYEKLNQQVSPWEAGSKKRFYIKSILSGYASKANPFISETKDRGRFEIELGNGFLYLEKCYNDLDGLVKEVMEVLEEHGVTK